MMLAELRAHFPFGFVLVTDESSTEPIPEWSSDEQQLTLADTAMVIKIRHEVDGPAVVRVWDSDPKLHDAREVATVLLRSPSRALRVSTATGDPFIRFDVSTIAVKVRVIASAPRHPDEVHLVVGQGSPEAVPD